MLQAGRLRHRIRIEERSPVTNSSGERVPSWTTFAPVLAAEIATMSGKEWLSGGGVTAGVDSKIVIRFIEGIDASMRAINLSDGTVYSIAAVLNDQITGREYITLMVTSGANDG